MNPIHPFSEKSRRLSLSAAEAASSRSDQPDEFEVVSLNVALPREVKHGDRVYATGIHKHPVCGPVQLSKLNFAGDGQGDLVNHGGPDKAVNLYPAEHYAYWRETLKLELPPAAFGENLTVRGLTEEAVSVGDEFELGEAVVQVTQPRQPCYKLADKLGVPEMVALVVARGFSGYYCRVLREGLVRPGDPLRLIRRDSLGVTIAEINRLLFHDRENRAALNRVLQVEALAASLRNNLAQRLDRL